MSVSDNELSWWRLENRPDKIHCDRNGCDNPATRQIAWRDRAYSEEAKKQEWRHIACRYHADWWITENSGLITGWQPDS